MSSPVARAKLSRERILSAALAIVDEEGLDALSMRRLGRALSVEAMSLYRHFRSKADLLDGLHEAVLARISVPPRTGDWRADAKAEALAFRDALVLHRGAIAVFVTRAAVTEGSLAHLERGLGLLVDAGFEPAVALRAFQSLYTLVVGHCAFHYGQADAEERPIDYAALPLEDFPNLFALGAEDYAPDAELELGLDAMLDGLARRLDDTR